MAADIQAARDLLDVLLSRLNEDQLSEAETWCRRFVAHGSTDMTLRSAPYRVSNSTTLSGPCMIRPSDRGALMDFPTAAG